MSIEKLCFGLYELDPVSLELRRSGQLRTLQPQPARALLALVERAGELVTREELALELWPEDTFVDAEAGLNVAIGQVRKALDDDAREPRFIETLPRRGYRFLAPVRRLSEDSGPIRVATLDDAGAVAHSPPTNTVSMIPRWLTLAASMAALLGLVVYAAFANLSHTPGLLRGGDVQWPRDPKVLELYEAAHDKLARLELPEACELLDDVTTLAPRAAGVYATLSRCWAEVGHDRKALDAAAHAQELAASLPRQERVAIEARYREARREWQAARDLYRGLYELRSDDPALAVDLARAETALGRPDRGLEILEAVEAAGEPRFYLWLADTARAAGKLELQRDAAETAFAMAKTIGATVLVAEALLSKAEARHHLGERDDALELVGEARTLLVGDRHRLASALVRRRDSIDAGLTGCGMSYEEALGIFRAAGDQVGIARSLIKIARNERAIHEPGAEAKLEEALDIARDLGNLHIEAEALNAQAIVRYYQMRTEESVADFTAAVERARQSGDRVLTAGILANLAGTMRATGDLDRAQTLADEAVDIARHVGSRFLFTLALYKAGQLARSRCDFELATTRLTEAIGVARSIEDERLVYMTRTEMAALLLDRGEGERAVRELEASIELWEGWHSPESADRPRLWLAEMYRDLGELDKAETLLRVITSHAAINASGAQLASAVLTEIEVERGDLEAAERWLRDVPDGLDGMGVDEQIVVARGRARWLAAQGRSEAALELIETLLEATERVGATRPAILARLAHAQVLTDLDDPRASESIQAVAAEARAAGFHHVVTAARRVEIRF
ncbi:MAG: tetratricopeptide repeat protein [Acidobacteriota bacterium]